MCTSLRRNPLRLTLGALTVSSMLLTGCAIGPKYVRPSVEVPPAYKELGPPESKGAVRWENVNPKDAALRGKWWEMFNDHELNTLEEKVDISNQNIAAASANFLAARAMIREARSQYYPTATTSPAIARSQPSPAQFGGLQSSSGHAVTVGSFSSYTLPVDASWEPDLWSRVRLEVRTNYLAAQVSAADLENVRLAAHAELAADYYELRGQDNLKQLLDSTVANYRDALDLVRAQYKAGISNDEAVASAETQLETAEVQETNLGILRAQYEHAIATLVGQSPSTFSIPVESLKVMPPGIPVGIPSELLQRRPDIAVAERAVARANAQIGVAKTAFFPNLILGASGGFGNTSFADWLTWPSRFWSLGPGVLTETIFDAGLRRATVQQYQASYDQTVANYRQSVLTAFQQVEDNLASLRVLSQDIQQQDAAVQSAGRNLQEATARYQGGLDPYLNVITAQTLLLSAQQTALNFRVQQMVSSVQLIEALGGGWDLSQIPSPQQLRAKTSQAPASQPGAGPVKVEQK